MNFKKNHLPDERDMDVILNKLNKYSRSKLLEIAHINAEAVNELVKGRRYRLESQIWASLRKAGYGPVLSRLAISAVEQDVSKREVFHLIKDYEKKGIIPPDQTTGKVIERAWFVSSKASREFPHMRPIKFSGKGCRT